MFPRGGKKISIVRRLALCLAAALTLASAAFAREDDPIGALLAEKVLKGEPSSLPVVIGLKLNETAQNLQETVEQLQREHAELERVERIRKDQGGSRPRLMIVRRCMFERLGEEGNHLVIEAIVER